MNHVIGDTVTVADYTTICNRTSLRDDTHRVYDENFAYFVNDMQNYCNKSFTIKTINKYGYGVVEHNYTLSDFMLASFNPIDPKEPYEYW